MHFVSYFQMGSIAFLLFRHPIVGMLVTLPFVWLLEEDPLIFLPGLLGAASTYAALRSLKERVWPGVFPACILTVPIMIMEFSRLPGTGLSQPVPWACYPFLILLTHPFAFSVSMMYRHTVYTVITMALCTIIFQDDLKMQLNAMMLHTLFLVVLSYFVDSKKPVVEEKNKEE